jgi:hypothetical protein
MLVQYQAAGIIEDEAIRSRLSTSKGLRTRIPARLQEKLRFAIPKDLENGIVNDIRDKQTVALTAPRRPLGPAKPGRNLFQLRVLRNEHVETFVVAYDPLSERNRS